MIRNMTLHELLELHIRMAEDALEYCNKKSDISSDLKKKVIAAFEGYISGMKEGLENARRSANATNN